MEYPNLPNALVRVLVCLEVLDKY